MKKRKLKRLGILDVPLEDLRGGWGIAFPKGCELSAAVVQDDKILKIKFIRPDIVEHQEGALIPHYTLDDIKALNAA